MKLPALEDDKRTIDMTAVDLLVAAQRAGGVDPLGLEPSFPGLITESVWSQGVAQGDVQAVDFATFNTFGYAVLHLTRQQLDVQVTGIPAVDPQTLLDSHGMSAYLAEKPEPVLHFSVLAQ